MYFYRYLSLLLLTCTVASADFTVDVTSVTGGYRVDMTAVTGGYQVDYISGTPPLDLGTNVVLWLEYAVSNEAAAGDYPDSSTWTNNGDQLTAGFRGQWTPDGLDLDSDDYVRVLYDASLMVTEFTLAAWIKVAATNNSDKSIITKANTSTLAVMSWDMRLHRGQVGLSLRTSAFIGWKTDTKLVTGGNWHHVAVSYVSGDIGSIEIYVDGIVQPVTFSGAGDANIRTSTDRVYIGGTGILTDFLGLVDDTYVISKQITSNEVWLLSQENPH